MKKKSFLLFAVALVVFISMLLLLEFQFVDAIDHYSKSIQNIFAHSNFKLFFLAITNLMSVLGIFFIIGCTIYVLRKKDAKKDIILYIGTILVCLAITNMIKIIVRRTRPLDMLLDVSGFSFPSSHSSIAMVVYGYLALLLKKYYCGNKKRFYIFLCILMIFLTGLSRIYFNVHYITDVIAGFSLGFILLYISNSIIKRVDKRYKR